MGPEISTNIGSMIRAMEQVVIPAIDGNDQLAREQSYLIMIYLRLLTDQHQHIFHFRLQEIREYHALVTDILRVSKSTDGEAVQRQAEARHVLDTAAPLLNLALPSYDALADTARELRESADELTRAAMDENNGCEDVRTSLADILLKQANCEALRERAWVSALGYDPDPMALPPLSELLSQIDS